MAQRARNRQRSHGFGTRRFTSPADAPRARGTHRGTGQQGIVTCPVCKAEVTTKRAEFTDKDSGIFKGDRLTGKHRFGGGRTNRYDVPCAGSLVIA
jgi:hypothetical protein